MKQSFYNVIPSNLGMVDVVCADARRMLLANGLEGCVFAVDLLLREFVNNAILHGNKSDGEKKVRVGFRIGCHVVSIGIRDEGPGFDWLAKQSGVPDEWATSGRGLAIGARYSGGMKYNPAGNKVLLVVAREG